VNPPEPWIGRLTKAAWTVVLAAVLVFVAWELLKRVLGPLLVVLLLVVVYRILLGQFRKGQW
jgi:F0F1-type ATP synthase assembly protein I